MPALAASTRRRSTRSNLGAMSFNQSTSIAVSTSDGNGDSVNRDNSDDAAAKQIATKQQGQGGCRPTLRTRAVLAGLIALSSLVIFFTAIVPLGVHSRHAAQHFAVTQVNMAGQRAIASLSKDVNLALTAIGGASLHVNYASLGVNDTGAVMALLFIIANACPICACVQLASADTSIAVCQRTSDPALPAPFLSVATRVPNTTNVAAGFIRAILGSGGGSAAPVALGAPVDPSIAPRQLPPAAQPWWPSIARGARVSAVHSDVLAGTHVATLGFPAGASRDLALTAALDFNTLFEDLLPFTSGDERRAMLFDAVTGVIVVATWCNRTNLARRVRTAENADDATIAQAVALFSREELLESPDVVTKLKLGFPGQVPVFGASVAPITFGEMRLRLLMKVSTKEIQEEIARGFWMSMLISVGVGLVVIALSVAATIVTLERPLLTTATSLRERLLIALSGEDEPSNRFVGDTGSESSAVSKSMSASASGAAATSAFSLYELEQLDAAVDDVLVELRRVRAFIPDAAFVAPNMEFPDDDPAASAPDDGRNAALSIQPIATDGMDVHSLRASSSLLSPISLSDAAAIAAVTAAVEGSDSDCDDADAHMDALAPGPSSAAPRSPNPLAEAQSSGSRSTAANGSAPAPWLKVPDAWQRADAITLSPSSGAVLRTANISILTLEVRGFAAAVSRLGPRGATRLCMLTAEVVEAAAHVHFGTVEAFRGDSAVVLFNALRPNVSHRRHAAECALKISAGVRAIVYDADGVTPAIRRADAAGLPLRKSALARGHRTFATACATSGEDPDGRLLPDGIAAGLGTGRGLVGNAGSAGLTRHCVLAVARDVAAMNLDRCRDLVPDPAAVAASHLHPAGAGNSSSGSRSLKASGRVRRASYSNSGRSHASSAGCESDAPSGVSAGPAQCVADGVFAGDISHSVVFQAFDLEAHRDGPDAPVRRAIKILLERPLEAPGAGGGGGANDGEWMYELERAQAANEFHHVNQGFIALARGDREAAAAELAAAAAKGPSCSTAILGFSRLQELVALTAKRTSRAAHTQKQKQQPPRTDAAA